MVLYRGDAIREENNLVILNVHLRCIKIQSIILKGYTNGWCASHFISLQKTVLEWCLCLNPGKFIHKIQLYPGVNRRISGLKLDGRLIFTPFPVCDDLPLKINHRHTQTCSPLSQQILTGIVHLKIIILPFTHLRYLSKHIRLSLYLCGTQKIYIFLLFLFLFCIYNKSQRGPI